MTQRQSTRGGASGFHHNPGDFSDLVGMRSATRQEFLKKNWHYMTEGRTRFAASLSDKFQTYHGEVAIDRKSGQFAFGF